MRKLASSVLTLIVLLNFVTIFSLPASAKLSKTKSNLKVLVLKIPETGAGTEQYWTAEEARKFNNVTRWLLDLYGFPYDELDATALTRETLYDGSDLKYSVIMDNGNRLDELDKDDIVLEAVEKDGLGLVMHTISSMYVRDALDLQDRPSQGWKDQQIVGEFSVTNDLHYITRMFYAPIEHVTHNLAQQQRTAESYAHGIRIEKRKDQRFAIANLVKQTGETTTGIEKGTLAPEIIAERYGAGRVVWFARPYYVYLKGSYFFVERDYSLGFLVGRALEWASQNGVLASKALYPNGNWFAHALITDGYYDFPPPGYTLNVTLPGSFDELITDYKIVEDMVEELGLKYTAAVIFRNNNTLGWDAGYNLTYWDAGKAALAERAEKGNELALGAFDYVDYGKIAKQSIREAGALLKKGRSAMTSIFGVESPVYIFSFVPEEVLISDDAYLAAFEAGFDVMVGGIYKTDFPYDLYGSIYPFYLNGAYEETAEGWRPRAVVVENNFYFDAITEATDLYYWEDVYKRGGALVTRLVPWGMYNLPITLSRFKAHVEEIRSQYSDVWWTTVGELGRYSLDRSKVRISATSEDAAGTIFVTVKNNGDNTVEGFTVKVRLDDQSKSEYQYASRPMKVKSVKEGGEKLERGTSWELKDEVEGKYYGAVFIWADLEPGQERTFEIKSGRGLVLPWAQILMFPIFFLGVFLAWFLLIRKPPKAPEEAAAKPA